MISGRCFWSWDKIFASCWRLCVFRCGSTYLFFQFLLFFLLEVMLFIRFKILVSLCNSHFTGGSNTLLSSWRIYVWLCHVKFRFFIVELEIILNIFCKYFIGKDSQSLMYTSIVQGKNVGGNISKICVHWYKMLWGESLFYE